MQWEGKSACVQVSASNEEFPEDVCRIREDCRVQAEDTVSERLMDSKSLGSARRGSNPLGVDCRGGEKQRKIVGG